MGIKTQYVQLDFCHEKERFICKSDRLGEVLKVLQDGDAFHLTYMDSTHIGTVKADTMAKPHGYIFQSDDQNFKVELIVGMYGYIEDDLPNSHYLGAEPEKYVG